MQNLLSISDEIKAVVTSCTGTPTAKLIALLNAAGITSTAEVAAILGVAIRTVQHAKRTSQNATNCANTQPIAAQPIASDATHCVLAQPIAPRARVLDKNLLTSLEDSSSKNINPLPPSKTKRAKPEFGKSEALEAFHAYNATAERLALPQAAKLTPERERAIIARLKAYGLDGWAQALDNIEKSPFLMGETDHQFRPTLDFVCQAKSFGKLHDGGYGMNRKIVMVSAATNIEYFKPAWYEEATRDMAAMGYGQ
jgi:hypothetical protein